MIFQKLPTQYVLEKFERGYGFMGLKEIQIDGITGSISVSRYIYTGTKGKSITIIHVPGKSEPLDVAGEMPDSVPKVKKPGLAQEILDSLNHT